MLFRDLCCTLTACKQKSRSKMHTLISKAKPLCLHAILAIAADASVKKKQSKPVEHQLNHKGTVEKVIKFVKTYFPSTFRSCEEGAFLATSKTFIDKMISIESNLDKNLECVPEKCDACFCTLEVWSRKTPRSYLITLGKLSMNNLNFIF